MWGNAINMIEMVGIGPFITLPLVISIMNGPYFLYAWLAGAILSFVDATVWSELGAAFPRAGGSYNFLKETYSHTRIGKLMRLVNEGMFGQLFITDARPARCIELFKEIKLDAGILNIENGAFLR